MNTYKLLTPGPLTTTDTVKESMLVDHCTWDDDYKSITQSIRQSLLDLAKVSNKDYTTVLMQGSGTFGVESVLLSVIPKTSELLLLSNGAYGERIKNICQRHGITCHTLDVSYYRVFNDNEVRKVLNTNNNIGYVAMVHSETTTGILNNIEEIGEVCREFNKTFIVDAMSSFGGINIPVRKYGIDYLVSSANKCIQGVPGFSFVICNKDKLMQTEGIADSLSLDLYDQWKTMEKDGKWRFTSPTHVVLAFQQAINELVAEGGIIERNKRYQNNMTILINGFEKLGLKSYLDEEVQGPIIATFEYPSDDFSFEEMYEFVKKRGYAIYPGKLLNMNTFRIGVIGEIYEEDINKLIDIMKEYFESK